MSNARLPVSTASPASDPADERECIRRAVCGCEDAAARLVRQHERLVWTFLWRMTGSRERTEDLFQEVWLRCWRTLPGFRGEAAFATYLLKAARHVVSDTLRHRHPESHAQLDPVDASGGSASSLDTQDHLTHLLRPIRGRAREALVLHHLHGLSFRDVADVMGVAEATARHYAHEAVLALRARHEGASP